MKKYIIILALILCGASSSIGQWIYQNGTGNLWVKDIKFFDANTGIIILGSTNPGMLKTTNGGNNWTLFDTTVYYYGLQTIDSVTMYAYGQRTSIYRIKRTFDKGITWDSVSVSSARMFWDFSFVNKDTGWVSGFNGGYLIWQTTNGGVTLVPQTGGIGNGQIFFLKQKVNGEYYGWQKNNDNNLWRTTNSGVNWYQLTVPIVPYIFYVQFVDENTGWFTSGFNGIYKTTNGGSNWVNQPLAPGIPGLTRSITKFVIIDKDTLYGINGEKTLPGGRNIGIIWKTTNRGLNWGYQDFDTSYHIGYLTSIDFINPYEGWAYNGLGVHTTNCGGNLILTSIKNEENIITDYEVSQNYPNPFNPSTKIGFHIKNTSNVSLSIYDIQGKEISNLINNKRYPAGHSEIIWNATGLATGIYFYRFEILNGNGVKVFSQTKRMIYMK